MTKRFFAPVLPCLAGIAATLLIGGSPAMAASATPATHPNVVILLIDDMGYGDISAHRSKWLSMIRWSGRRWRTPHIESILVSFLIASLVAPSVVSANSPG
jgi:hypothetical protein